MYVYAKDVHYQASTASVADSLRNGNKLTRRNIAPFRDVYILYKILCKLLLDSLIFFYSNILFADYIIEMWQKQIFAVKYYI